MNESDFLPGDYKAPAGAYMKLADGENTFRALSSAVIGWMYWNKESKPVRLRQEPMGTPADIRIGKEGKPEKVKHFWAFAVWNYAADRVQILELTQSSIQTAITALVKNKKWGSPNGYDITITRTGDGLGTEYTVMPNPHTPLDEKAAAAWRARSVNLEKLFDGGDPYGGAAEEVEEEDKRAYKPEEGEAHPDDLAAI